MIWTKLLLLAVMAVSVSVSYDRSINYWEAFAPGKLLERLDALTQTNTDANPNIIPAQAKADDEVLDEEENDNEAEIELSAETSGEEEPHSAEDYERTYEQFVREHFDRATDDDENLEEVADGDVPDASLDAEASQVQHQRCQRVKKKGQLCEICRHPKNGEVSETCSYSHADQPEQYAYGSGRQYRRYRDIDQTKKEPTSKPSSLCVRRLKDKRVCYECQDSGGNQLERCYDTEQTQKIKKKPRKSNTLILSDKKVPEAQQSQHMERRQRIYKRTISYSYAQGSNKDKDANTTATTTTPATVTILSIPHRYHQRRKQNQVNHINPSFPQHDSSPSQKQ